MKRARYLLAVLTLTAIASLQNQAQAQTGQPVGITVSPVVDNISINPGQTLNRLIKITNPTNSSVTLYPTTLNFTTDNDQGKPVFYSDSEKSSRYSLSSWLKPNVSSITIAPLQFTELGYTITAPFDAEPGGHYGSVLLSTQPPKLDSSSTQVSVVGLIGTLLLVNVPGNVVTSGAISSFDAPTFLTTGPANFNTTVSNTGNTHFFPVGDIKIKNWSGGVVGDVIINQTSGAVLPESQRQFASIWSFDWKSFGRYTATATIAYGSPEQIMTDTRIFYVFPYWSIIVAVLFLLLVIWLILRRTPRPKKPRPVTPEPVRPPASKIVMR